LTVLGSRAVGNQTDRPILSHAPRRDRLLCAAAWNSVLYLLVFNIVYLKANIADTCST
jgi:hypothetical protein